MHQYDQSASVRAAAASAPAEGEASGSSVRLSSAAPAAALPPVGDLQGPPAAGPRAPSPADLAYGHDPATQPLSNFDALTEQLAHGMLYGEPDAQQQAFLRNNGYSAGPLVSGAHDLALRTFVPLQAGGKPIVAFRGTVPKKIDTVLTDIDPHGVGMWQFVPNQGLIHSTLQAAAGHGPVVVSGHSLGGTLAQLAACTWPQLCSQVITFQAPGVEPAMASKLLQYNAQHPAQQVLSHHYRVNGDLIPLGGKTLTPGTITDFNEPGNPLSKHLSLPLSQFELSQGRRLPDQDPRMAATLGDVHSTAEDHKLAIGEDLRHGVGVGAEQIHHAAEGAEAWWQRLHAQR